MEGSLVNILKIKLSSDVKFQYKLDVQLKFIV